MSIERREFVRQRVSRVEVRVASQEAFRASYLRDLSMGGLFVRSRQPLPQGTAVVVELAVEKQPPVRLRGEVMRQEHAPDGTARGFGVRFSTVDAETKAALEHIIRTHQQPDAPPSVDRAELETQLAEARGTIEAYEEALALVRENEAAAQQQLEATQAECQVLVSVSHELQGKVQALETELNSLRVNLDSLARRLAAGAVELEAARASTAKSGSAREESVSRLLAEFEVETERSAALRAVLEAEVLALKEQLEARDDGKLRAELQEFAAQLDDERLKSMALERALQRFVEMGGIIPKRSD